MFNKKIQAIIKDSVTKLFQQLRLNLIGPDKLKYGVPTDVQKFDPKTTIPNAYLQANTIQNLSYGTIDKEASDRLQEIADSYVTALEQKTLAELTRIVAEKSDEIKNASKISGKSSIDLKNSKLGDSIYKEIRIALKDQTEKAAKAADVIVTHELHNAQNVGAFDGILGAAKAIGVSDPTVFKLIVRDNVTCKKCIRLWTVNGSKVPKVYKLSELAASPGSFKDPVASVQSTHPHCRCLISVLMTGFGFDDSGNIVYKGQDHDEYKKQNS